MVLQISVYFTQAIPKMFNVVQV